MSETYIDDLFDKNEHEDDVLNERYRRATSEKVKVKKETYSTYDDLPDEEEFFDDKDLFEGSNYIDLDGLDNIEDIETLIDTGSSALYQKERTSEVTGKKVKNYVDNDTFCTNVMLWNKACVQAEKEGKPKPPMPDVIGIQMLKIADGLSKRYNFRNYCVDDQTEALTQRGWLKYNQITTDDIILSLDVETNELRWSKIFEVFRNENYDGKMFTLTNDYIDAFVTPEHKFVTQHGLKKVEDITINDVFIANGIYIKDTPNMDTPSHQYRSELLYECFTDTKQCTFECKTDVDYIQIICSLNGLSSSIRYDDETKLYTLTVTDQVQYEMVDINHSPFPTEHYKGVIWCPRTEYGTFMCRRNGKAYITGNTYIDEMREDAIFMAIRAVKNFDPEKSTNAYGYFNQVMWLAMTTRLKSEEKQHNIRMSLLQDPMYLGVETQNSRNNSGDFDKERLISMYDD